MEQARMLDERLRRIIREISNDTGQEIKNNLLRELTGGIQQNQKQQITSLLHSLNQALKKI